MCFSFNGLGWIIESQWCAFFFHKVPISYLYVSELLIMTWSQLTLKNSEKYGHLTSGNSNQECLSVMKGKNRRNGYVNPGTGYTWWSKWWRLQIQTFSCRVALAKKNTGEKRNISIIAREIQVESNQYFSEIVRKIMSLVTKQTFIIKIKYTKVL